MRYCGVNPEIIEYVVAVNVNIREGMRMPGTPMVIKLFEMSIIRPSLMHLV